jgi:hypothetical protein
MRRSIEHQRPEQCEAPYILRVVQVVRLLVMRRQGIVQRRKGRYFVVDRDTVIGHRDGAAVQLQRRSIMETWHILCTFRRVSKKRASLKGRR